MPEKPLPMEDIVRDYKAGMSTLDLAERYGAHASTIARRLGRLGVIRSVADANRYNMARKLSTGDLYGLADELGTDVHRLRDLLVKHGFLAAVSGDPAELAAKFPGEARRRTRKRPRRGQRNRKVFRVDRDGRLRRDR